MLQSGQKAYDSQWVSKTQNIGPFFNQVDHSFCRLQGHPVHSDSSLVYFLSRTVTTEIHWQLRCLKCLLRLIHNAPTRSLLLHDIVLKLHCLAPRFLREAALPTLDSDRVCSDDNHAYPPVQLLQAFSLLEPRQKPLLSHNAAENTCTCKKTMLNCKALLSSQHACQPPGFGVATFSIPSGSTILSVASAAFQVSQQTENSLEIYDCTTKNNQWHSFCLGAAESNGCLSIDRLMFDMKKSQLNRALCCVCFSPGNKACIKETKEMKEDGPRGIPQVGVRWA